MNLFKDYANAIEDDSLAWSKELILIEPYLEEAPFKDLCGDDVMGTTPSIGHIDSICIDLLY